MFLFQRLDFVALVGLWIQALAAWILVILIKVVGGGDPKSKALRSFLRAFSALALALSVMSARFFQAHEVDPTPFWLDGAWAPAVCYGAYQFLKSVFAFGVVEGCFHLAGRAPPPWLHRSAWPVAAVSGLAPIVAPDVSDLLILQAPLMMSASWICLRVLEPVGRGDFGRRMVRWALLGLLATWTLHGLAALLRFDHAWARTALALNSLFDLVVQLALGMGLLVSALQQGHERLRSSELDRERLGRQLARDETLRALGTLVSGVAHELNNPLTVILGYSEFLQDVPVAEGHARVIAEQAERCRGIVRNLGALAGQSSDRRERQLVDDVVRRVVRGLDSARVGTRQIRIEVEPKGLFVDADRTGLEQVLANLLTNALDASPRDGVVTVCGGSVTGGTMISVTDRGPGIPPELQTRLFEPFFSTKAPGKGMGLGLAIVHAIVRSHGGTISASEGAAGRGARFEVFLPLGVVSEAGGPRTSSGHRPVRGAGRHLLIVDDDAAVRSVVRRSAERAGWVVSEVESAEAALEDPIPLTRFDVVLCDLRMPGMGGRGLHDRLARTDPAALARVVFATGDLASVDTVHFSQVCTRPLLPKPFAFEELMALLDQVATAADAASAALTSLGDSALRPEC